MATEAQRPRIQVPVDVRAGVWANWAAVEFTTQEFTLHFARLGAFPDGPSSRILVSRVNLSHSGFRDLLDRGDRMWKEFARLSMPGDIRDV